VTESWHWEKGKEEGGGEGWRFIFSRAPLASSVRGRKSLEGNCRISWGERRKNLPLQPFVELPKREKRS